jgi:hypothetical protein
MQAEVEVNAELGSDEPARTRITLLPSDFPEDEPEVECSLRIDN